MRYRLIKIISILTCFSWLSTGALAQDHRQDIAGSIIELHKNTTFTPEDTITLDFKTFHTQGMVKIDDHYYLSAVEEIEGTETYANTAAIEDFSITRSAGKGRAWLFKFSSMGKLITKVELSKGDAYHPGGIDYDGTYIWVPVGEYRPNSKSNIYKIDPVKMTSTLVFTVNDHIGNMVYNPVSASFHGSSWGGRRLYRWKLNDEGHKISETWQANPSHYIDYQDCHYAGSGAMLCGGVQTYQTPTGEFSLGGIELIDISSEKVSVLHQLPITKYLPDGLVLSHNPFWVERLNQKLRFYFMPENDGQADLHIYDVALPDHK